VTLEILYNGEVVAELERANGKFVFGYCEKFKTLGLSPLPGLPFAGAVVSPELPAFFRERIPDSRRPEIRQHIRVNNIDEKDDMEMLAQFSKKSITDSYELRVKGPL